VTLRERGLAAAARTWDALPVRWRRRVLAATQARFLLGVVGVVADGDGRILLLEHRFRTPWRWGLPGGFVDRGETLEGALARELLEELGLRVVLDPGPFDTELYPEAGHVTVALLGRVPGATAAPRPRSTTEVLSAGFFGPRELPEGLYPRHRAIAERYFAGRRA
jgi:8-oxo-dGTP diphosphatase